MTAVGPPKYPFGWPRPRRKHLKQPVRVVVSIISKAITPCLIAVVSSLATVAGMSWFQSHQSEPWQVRDQQGIVRMRAGMFSHGSNGAAQPAIVFYAPDGKTELLALTSGKTDSEVLLRNPESSARLELKSHSSGAQIRLCDVADTERLSLEVVDRAAGFQVADERATPRVSIADGMTSATGLVVGDPSGRARVGLFVDGDGPGLVMKDEAQQSRIAMTMLGLEGPQLAVFNAKGKTTAVFNDQAEEPN